MFIYTNCKENMEFKVIRKNNLVRLETNINEIKYKSIEMKLATQFFCIPHRSLIIRNDGGMDKGEKHVNEDSETIAVKSDCLLPAKMFCIERCFEKEVKKDDEITFLNLISEFGDKWSKDRVKKKHIERIKTPTSILYNLPNQILPEYNKNTEKVDELFDTKYLFSEKVRRIMKDMNLDNSHISAYISGTGYQEDLKEVYAGIICISTVLNCTKYLKYENLPADYRFFYDEIKSDIVRGKLPSLAKDKLIIKLYILLLIANDYEMALESFPKYGIGKLKIVKMLKSIGCTLTGTGIVKLTKKPTEWFNSK